MTHPTSAFRAGLRDARTSPARFAHLMAPPPEYTDAELHDYISGFLRGASPVRAVMGAVEALEEIGL